jgi:signal peptidase I
MINEGVPSTEAAKPFDGLTALLRTGFKAVILVALFLVIAIFINYIFPSYVVEGHSMQPMLDGNGNERIYVNRLSYITGQPERQDVVVLHNPGDETRYMIKRVIGLPGETVEIHQGVVSVDGRVLKEGYLFKNKNCSLSHCIAQRWELGEDEYFVLGDNRNHSYDSSFFGPVKQSNIIGEAVLSFEAPLGVQFID